MLKRIIDRTPLPLAGMALAFAGTGNLLVPLGFGFLFAFMALSCVCLVLLAAKIILHFDVCKADFANPLLAAVFPAAFMALMQIAGCVRMAWYELGFGMWVIAIAVHLIYIVWYLVRFARGFSFERVFPTWFVLFVGIVMIPATAPNFSAEAVGLYVLWIGLLIFVVCFVLITLRLVKIPLPEAARPTVCIYAAPVNLSLVGYLACSPTPNAVVVGALAIAGQLLMLFACAWLPKLLKLPFYPSFASMTFPFCISAIGLRQALDSFALPEAPWAIGLYGFCIIESLFALAMVGYVTFFFIKFLTKK